MPEEYPDDEGRVYVPSKPLMVLAKPEKFIWSKWLREGMTAGTLLTLITIGGGFIATQVRNEDRLNHIENRLKYIEERYVSHDIHDRIDSWMHDLLVEVERRLSALENFIMEHDRRR